MKMPISPMDYYFYRESLYTIQFVFSFHGAINIKKLKLALNDLVHYNPIYSSKINIENNKIFLNMSENKIPLSFQKISSEIDLHTQETINSLICSVKNLENQPLIKINITQTPLYSHMAVSFSHLLGDGFSFFMFLSQLSQVFKGEEVLKINLDERMALSKLTGRGVKVTSESLFSHTGYTFSRNNVAINSQLHQFYFSLSDIKALKNQNSISTNNILMADLIKKYYKRIPKDPLGNIILRCPVDYRRKFSLISKNYFGNAVKDAVIRFKEEEIPHLSLIDVALKVKKSIQDINENGILESLEHLDAYRTQYGIHAFKDLSCPGLLVSNLSHLPYGEIDFDFGAPFKVSHSSLNPRLAVILPGTNNGYIVKFQSP